MATENQQYQICTCHLHPKKGNLPTSPHQSSNHTTDRNSQKPRPSLRQTPHLERTRNKNKETLDHKTRELIWLIGKLSPLSLTNKILIYKMVIKPILTYGLALWGCTAASNLEVIQRYQKKILRLSLFVQGRNFIAKFLLVSEKVDGNS
jgi:hypothetical protein